VIDFDNIDVTKTYVLMPPFGFRLHSEGIWVSYDDGEGEFIPAEQSGDGFIIDFTPFPGIWAVDMAMELSLRPKTFDLEFTKLNAADKTPMPGIIYVIQNVDGSLISQEARFTDENGFVSFAGLCVDESFWVREYMPDNPRQVHDEFFVSYGEYNGGEMYFIERGPGVGGKAYFRSRYYTSAFSDWVIVEFSDDLHTGVLSVVFRDAQDRNERFGGVTFNLNHYNPRQLASRAVTDQNGEILFNDIHALEQFRLITAGEQYHEMYVAGVNGARVPLVPLEDFRINFISDAVRHGHIWEISLEIIGSPNIINENRAAQQAARPEGIFDLEFTRYDITNETPMEGIIYILQRIGIGATPQMSQISDANGFVSFTNLDKRDTYRLREFMPDNPRTAHEEFTVSYGEFNGEYMPFIDRAAGLGGKTFYRPAFYTSAPSDWVIAEFDNTFPTGILNVTVRNALNREERLGGAVFALNYYHPQRITSRSSTDRSGEILFNSLNAYEQFRLINISEQYHDMYVVGVNGARVNPVPLHDFRINFVLDSVRNDNIFELSLEIIGSVGIIE